MNDDIPGLYQQLLESYFEAIKVQVQRQSSVFARFHAMYKETYKNLSKKKRDEVARAIRIAGKDRAAESYGYQMVEAICLFHPLLTRQKDPSMIFMEVIT